MFKSLYFKIVLILLIFIIAVMCAVGAILLNGVASYYLDDFSSQMSECFAEDSLLMIELNQAAAGDNPVTEMKSVLSSYGSLLGIDKYRNYYILSSAGEMITGSDIELGMSLTVTPNLLSAISKNGDNIVSGGMDYSDWAVRMPDPHNTPEKASGNDNNFSGGTDGGENFPGSDNFSGGSFSEDFSGPDGGGDFPALTSDEALAADIASLSTSGGGHIIYVKDSLEEMRQMNGVLFRIVFQAMVVGIFIAVLLSFFLAKSITAPLQSLTYSTQLVASGEFTNEIDVRSDDEIGVLAENFNYMRERLKATLEEVDGEREKLETVLACLRDPVIAFTEDGDVLHSNKSADDLFGRAAGNVSKIGGRVDNNKIDGSRGGGNRTDGNKVDSNRGGANGTDRSRGGANGTDSSRAGGNGINSTMKLNGYFEALDVPLTSEGGVLKLITDGQGDNAAESTKDGYIFRDRILNERVYDVSCATFRYAGGKKSSLGCVIIIHDVTGRFELDESRREFVANVSHELKTPLTAIKGAVETVRMDDEMDAGTRAYFLDMALSESDRMKRIVSDLLVLSRLDNKKTKWNIEKFDLRQSVRRLCDVMRSDIEAHGHRVTFGSDRGSAEITADRQKIEQVVMNIMSNAIKYTPDGGLIDIKIRSRGRSYVSVIISDNGIGIPAEDVSHLFERFYRVEKSRNQDAGGTGLGLAIAKEIVEAHGGRIGVESELGHGTKVEIELPVECRLKQG